MWDQEFFGYYGQVVKIRYGCENVLQGKEETKVLSVYVSYEKESSTIAAMLALEGFKVNNFPLSSSFGRNKYCIYFLKNNQC